MQTFIQYPSEDILGNNSFSDIQPIRFGACVSSAVAHFGDLEPIKTGLAKDQSQIQSIIDQRHNRIKKIKYKWQNFICSKYFSFEFLGQEGQRLGFVENASSVKVQRWIQCGKRMKEEKNEEIDLGPAEVIVAIRFGLNKYNSVLNFQFMIANLDGNTNNFCNN